MNKSKGYVSKIETMGTLDGPGLRVVIFLSGCPLRCQFCHNPEMWHLEGQEMTVNEVMTTILKYQNYLIEGGVTFSGGEPLFQHDFLKELLICCKKANLHTCLDTSGVGQADDLLEYVDLVILDIKSYDPYQYEQITSHHIDQFSRFLSLCQKKQKKLWIRQVIVPTINDNIPYIKGLKKYLENITNIEKIELLPYHNMALSKYQQLHIPYSLQDIPPMSIDKLKELEKYLF